MDNHIFSDAAENSSDTYVSTGYSDLINADGIKEAIQSEKLTTEHTDWFLVFFGLQERVRQSITLLDILSAQGGVDVWNLPKWIHRTCFEAFANGRDISELCGYDRLQEDLGPDEWEGYISGLEERQRTLLAWYIRCMGDDDVRSYIKQFCRLNSLAKTEGKPILKTRIRQGDFTIRELWELARAMCDAFCQA